MESMDLHDLIAEVERQSKEFGFCFKDQTRKPKNAVWRENIPEKNEEEFRKNAYFGIINADQHDKGAYEGFSLVVFPNAECTTHFVIALCVGTGGFGNDEYDASSPHLRRKFLRLRDEKYTGQQFFKVNFLDIKTRSAINDHLDDIEDLEQVVRYYSKYLSACQIVDVTEYSQEHEVYEIVRKWLATYAEFRNVASNKDQRNSIRKSLPDAKDLDDYSEGAIYRRLLKERFIILQGAPGTGKTWTANKIAEDYFSGSSGETFFEQFHAETTYSDFVYGIRPKTDGENLLYVEHYGTLIKAIEAAESGKPTLLIIDEINRANLSSVLGPVFYLFEKNATANRNNLKVGNKKISKLPDSLYVVGTMNTADRSLAVVDFALRRRFSWITLRPHVIAVDEEQEFIESEFDYFSELFNKFASSEELNLQPGQSYFIAENHEAWKQRLRYELVPLMKEYFSEGYLKNAVSGFSDYVYDQLGIDLYE